MIFIACVLIQCSLTDTLANRLFYRQYYPDPHPVRGVQLVRVGKLQHHLANIEEALDTFTQVREGLFIILNFKCQNEMS